MEDHTKNAEKVFSAVPYPDTQCIVIIFSYIYSKNQPNVGTHTSPMDCMGMAHLQIMPVESKNANGGYPLTFEGPVKRRFRGVRDVLKSFQELQNVNVAWCCFMIGMFVS